MSPKEAYEKQRDETAAKDDCYSTEEKVFKKGYDAGAFRSPEVLAIIEAAEKAKHKIICPNAGRHNGICDYCLSVQLLNEALKQWTDANGEKR